MTANLDGLVPKEMTDKEYLITFADELERAVKNAQNFEEYIKFSNELALIISKRLRDISEKV